MYRKKIYGSYRTESCPFCERTATTLNSQKLPVCHQHKNAVLGEVKCSCGDYLDIMTGKYGAFFNCMNCGPQNLEKIYSINRIVDVSENSSGKSTSSSVSSGSSSRSSSNTKQASSSHSSSKKMYSGHEETIRSDDPRYF